jgi:hypothetical protein
LERASIPNLFVCWQHKIVLDVVVSNILIGADQIQELSFLFGNFLSVSISVTKKCQGARVGEMRISENPENYLNCDIACNIMSRCQLLMFSILTWQLRH